MKETKPIWMIKNKDQLDELKQNRTKALRFLNPSLKEIQPMLKELIPYQTMTLQMNTSDAYKNPNPTLWTPPKGYGLNVSDYNYASLSLLVNTHSTTSSYSYIRFSLEDSTDDFNYSLIESSHIQMSIADTNQEYTFRTMRKFVGFSNFIRPKIETAGAYPVSFTIRATLMLEKL